MRNLTLILFIFSGLFSYSQIEYEKEYFSDEFIKTYDLKGNVKYAEIIEIEEDFTSDEKITYKIKLHFNKGGYLQKKYSTYNDGFEYLAEKNVYDENNQIIHKIKYSRKEETIDDKAVFLKEFEDYQIKYFYDSVGNLLSQHEKSHKENDFFLTKRYSYENNLLIEKLVINHHFGPNRVEWTSSNFLLKNTFNSDGLLVKQQHYAYNGKEFNRYIVDGVEQFELIIQNEKTLDTTKFVLQKEWIKKYNQAKQLIFEEMRDYSMPKDTLHLISTFEYFGSMPSKVTRQFKDRYITSNSKTYHILNKLISSYDYQIIKNDTLISSEMSAFKYEASDDLEIGSIYKYEYNSDGTYLKVSYKNNIIGHTEKYNKYGQLVESVSVDKEMAQKVFYKYDANGNWVYKQRISLPDMKEIELVERKLEYYD